MIAGFGFRLGGFCQARGSAQNQPGSEGGGGVVFTGGRWHLGRPARSNQAAHVHGALSLSPAHLLRLSAALISHFLWLLQVTTISLLPRPPEAPPPPFRRQAQTLRFQQQAHHNNHHNNNNHNNRHQRRSSASHQDSVFSLAAPQVLLDSTHEFNGLLVQNLPDAL